MSQFYTDQTRESDTYALPDAEVFYVSKKEAKANVTQANAEGIQDEDFGEANIISESGWYYWFCFPGCLPDSDPYGPFETEDEAIADAREQNG